MRIFIDANVFYAAIYSSTGASRQIILMGIRGEVTLVVSRLILEEVERNLTKKTPETLPLFRQFVDAVPFEIVEPTRREVLEAIEYVVLKDAPVVAAARRAKVDYLVSLDRKHLVGKPVIEDRSGLKIVLPEQMLSLLRSSE